ncbi:MAG: hypothetical protein F4066_12130 [Chloroflexi bacterium]|nr:hypothetical protein [Chloroflexota bacterium]MXX32814.1 hypothetical protein [Chloroflexota bacterium]MYI05587.1 hypothetical protein [Chloroflexota bacterium]
MWAPLMTVPNRYVAETLRELLFAEGVSVRFVIEPDRKHEGDFAPVILMVPDSKTHVAREILGKV